MGELLPMGTPGGISWDAASVVAPQIPMLPAGEDAMSATISAVLPTLGAPLTASVAALSARENQFSGKVGAAESAYQNADASGGQSVGQLSSMLGQVGQMAQQAGGSAGGGGGGGGFASLMQQAMQAFQSGGSGNGSSGGSQSGAAGSGSQGATPTNGAQPSQSKGEAAQERSRENDSERDAREHQKPGVDEKEGESPTGQARPPADVAGAGDGSQRQGEGRGPVTAPEQPRREDGDLARRM